MVITDSLIIMETIMATRMRVQLFLVTSSF